MRGRDCCYLRVSHLWPWYTEIEGLKRKLTSWLSPADAQLRMPWDIGECIGTSWRPNFDTVFYPYLPPHITRPKECKKLFIIPLPDKALFAVGVVRLQGSEFLSKDAAMS